MREKLEFLEKQGVDQRLIDAVIAFHKEYEIEDEIKGRVPAPMFEYYGREVWEQAIYAVLSGENLLLVGSKATGKNVLCDNLAYVFGRPLWNVSFNLNTDSNSLLGSDTFKNGEVVLKRGPIYECATYGGFGVLDEINMAKNEAMSVLHSTLDYRREIDMTGYERLKLHKATRFIATMNFGYAGTRDLNEALASRFLTIQMPLISDDNLSRLLLSKYPSLNADGVKQFVGIFQELQKKASHSEISSKSVDLRGLISAVKLIHMGLAPVKALQMAMVNKTFDEFEHKIVSDVIAGRIGKNAKALDFFD